MKAEDLQERLFEFEFPYWSEEPLFSNKYDYIIIKGGRGSGKTTTVAEKLVFDSCVEHCFIICAREFQNSVEETVYRDIVDCIKKYKLEDAFKINDRMIYNKFTDTEFIFKGLWRNTSSLKSMPKITHFWLEEGDKLTRESWTDIYPTIREEGSKFISTFNPKKATDVLYNEFIIKEPLPKSIVVHINWNQNKYFTDKLRSMMLHDRKADYGKYRHVWLGELLVNSEAQVFKTPQHWVVDKFDDDPKAFKYFGLDFGFSQDPTAGVRCYIKDNTLYVTHEAVKLGLEIDDTGKFLEDRLPDLRKYCIYADNARPESISFIKRQSYNIKAVTKGKGSVEDGIEYMKSFDKIVIHKRCVYTIEEFTNYSYKVDERSGIISTDLVDDNNHCIDAIRYGLERCMKNKSIDYTKWLD
jgi:phage terminase large subunit